MDEIFRIFWESCKSQRKQIAKSFRETPSQKANKRARMIGAARKRKEKENEPIVIFTIRRRRRKKR